MKGGVIMEEKRDGFMRNRFILYPLRGFVIALIPWFTHLFVYRHMKSLSEDLNLIAIDASLFFVFSLFILALIYNSFTLYFATYDREERELFFSEDGGETKSFFGERKHTLTKLSFWLEICSALLFTGAIVFLGGFGDIDYFVLQLPISQGGARWIGFLALAAYLFILLLDRRCEARKYWQQLSERNELGRLESKVRMAIRGLAIIFLYPLATPVLPMLLYFIINVCTILWGIAKMLSIVGFIFTVAALIGAIYLLKKLRFYRIRKKIENRISAAAEKFGYRLRLYAREERKLHNCNGYVEKGNNRYYFKIMASPSRFTPLYFMHGGACYLHKFGTKNHFRSIEQHVQYNFDAPGYKSIILPKITNYIFVKESGSVRRIYEGDSFWSYIIYNPLSFLGNLERECIGRSNAER
jgi:hypothetical protein